MNQRKQVRNYGSLVLLLLAFLCVCGIGVGYAYMAVTSEQDINQNELEDSYIVLSTNSTDVLDVLAFDTVKDGNGTITYNVHTDGASVIGSTPMQKISIDDWTVSVADTNSHSTTYGLKVTVDPFDPTSGLHYVMVIDDGDAFEVAVEYNALNGWTFAGLKYDTDYNVALYVYGTATTFNSGFTNYSANPAIEGSVFTFLATADTA